MENQIIEGVMSRIEIQVNPRSIELQMILDEHHPYFNVPEKNGTVTLHLAEIDELIFALSAISTKMASQSNIHQGKTKSA